MRRLLGRVLSRLVRRLAGSLPERSGQRLDPSPAPRPPARRTPAGAVSIDARARVAPPPPPPALRGHGDGIPARRGLAVRLLFDDGTEADLSADPMTQKQVARVVRVMLPPPPPSG